MGARKEGYREGEFSEEARNTGGKGEGKDWRGRTRKKWGKGVRKGWK